MQGSTSINPSAGGERVAGRLKVMTSTANSPDGTVRVTLGGAGSTVEFRAGALAGHTARSIAAEVTAAVTAAIGDRRRMAASMFDPPREGPPPTDAVARRRARFDEAVAAITVNVTSARGLATVEWRGGHDLQVRIRQGTLGLGLTEERLATDVASAVADAIHQHSRRIIEIHKEVYR